MKPLSPVDAISPAFSRTRTLLTPPGASGFRFWFFVRTALVAALTHPSFYGFGIGLFMNIFSTAAMSTHRFPGGSHFAFAPSGMTATIVAIAVIGGLIGLALWVLLGWLWCRLRFTLFDLVVYRHGRIGLAWSRYGAQAWRFLGLVALVSLGMLLLIAVTVGPLFLHLFLTLGHLSAQQINGNPFVIFEQILPMYGAILLVALAAGLLDALMQDFLLPPMAIEDAPLESSFSRLFQLVRAAFWPLVFYLVLRLVIELGFTWVGGMVLFLVFLVLGLGGGGIGFILYRSLWHAGVGGAAVFILYCVVAALILIALYFLAVIALYGTVAVVKQCYAAYFYGSCYPALGDRLEPPAPAPPAEVLAPPPDPLPPSLPPVSDPPPVW